MNVEQKKELKNVDLRLAQHFHALSLAAQKCEASDKDDFRDRINDDYYSLSEMINDFPNHIKTQIKKDYSSAIKHLDYLDRTDVRAYRK